VGDGFIPIGWLPKDLRNLLAEKVRLTVLWALFVLDHAHRLSVIAVQSCAQQQFPQWYSSKKHAALCRSMRWRVLLAALVDDIMPVPVVLLTLLLACCCLVQRAHELVGRELPVMVAEVLPDEHRIRFNCIAAVAAQRAALQPAALITGVVTEVGMLQHEHAPHAGAVRLLCNCWGCGVTLQLLGLWGCFAMAVFCSHTHELMRAGEQGNTARLLKAAIHRHPASIPLLVALRSTFHCCVLLCLWLQVRPSYAWVAMQGLEYGGFRAMLHRKAFSVAQDFRSLEVRAGAKPHSASAADGCTLCVGCIIAWGAERVLAATGVSWRAHVAAGNQHCACSPVAPGCAAPARRGCRHHSSTWLFPSLLLLQLVGTILWAHHRMLQASVHQHHLCNV
jgi:hypothetical protein